MKIVYVDGVFDLFHFGHLEFLKAAKSHGYLLIVGVISDEDCATYKRKPVIEHSLRCEILKHIDVVDIVIENPPLKITEEFIFEHQINLVIHGNDNLQLEFFDVPIKLGKMKYIPYTPVISTTKIIKKILTEYNGT